MPQTIVVLVRGDWGIPPGLNVAQAHRRGHEQTHPGTSALNILPTSVEYFARVDGDDYCWPKLRRAASLLARVAENAPRDLPPVRPDLSN